MSSEHVLGHKDSVDVQADDQATVEEPELRPTVELESQAKVDTNHPDARMEGMTLAAEERFLAEEKEIARTRLRMDDRQDSTREARTRTVAAEGSRERRRQFQQRAASVDRWQDPDGPDPQATLGQEELATVNREADRLADEVRGRSRAALARRLAERIADGTGPTAAVVGVLENARTARGTIVPIGELEEIPRQKVSVAGTVRELWTPSSSAIRQVGLIEDETGATKITSWARSQQPLMREGERVRVRLAAKNWYQGRVSIAVTGTTRLVFPDRA